MMDSSFVEAVVEAINVPQDMGGMVVVPKGWTQLRPHRGSVRHLDLHTLQSVIGYVARWAEKDHRGMGLGGRQPLLVHVVNPTMVHVLGPLDHADRDYARPIYVQVSATPCDFLFGQWLDAETATISLMTKFFATPERDALLALLAGIRENQVRETTDDGVSQEVTTRGGVTLVNRTRVPSPIMLAPFRTFRELPQPTSPFVVRLKASASPTAERPQIALFEADSATWKIEATQEIWQYLTTGLSTLQTESVVVIA